MSSVVDAPAEKVWMLIGRFDAVVDWLPFVKSSPIEDGGDPTRVGCVRVLTQKDGAVFREGARCHMPSVFIRTRSSAHQFLFGTIALRVLPITDGDRSSLILSGPLDFEIDPEYEAQLVELMNRNFLTGASQSGREIQELNSTRAARRQ